MSSDSKHYECILRLIYNTITWYCALSSINRIAGRWNGLSLNVGCPEHIWAERSEQIANEKPIFVEFSERKREILSSAFHQQLWPLSGTVCVNNALIVPEKGSEDIVKSWIENYSNANGPIVVHSATSTFTEISCFVCSGQWAMHSAIRSAFAFVMMNCVNPFKYLRFFSIYWHPKRFRVFCYAIFRLTNGIHDHKNIRT